MYKKTNEDKIEAIEDKIKETRKTKRIYSTYMDESTLRKLDKVISDFNRIGIKISKSNFIDSAIKEKLEAIENDPQVLFKDMAEKIKKLKFN